ncbi:unnamed protein product [Scytosiphon promiscuus]
MACFCRNGNRFFALLVLASAVATSTGVWVREQGVSGATAVLRTREVRRENGPLPPSATLPKDKETPRRPSHRRRRRRFGVDSHCHHCTSSPSLPVASLRSALRARGGAKLVPSKTTPGSSPAGASGASSRPALGPITRRSAADSAEKGDDAKEDGQQEFAPQFLDFQSRVGFMKKVYLTLSVQLVYTGLVCAAMRGFEEPILRLIYTNGRLPQILFFIGTLGTIISTHAIMWSNKELRQSFPRNLPLLTAYTTAWALYVGVFSLMFTRGSVIRAVFQSAFVVGSLTAYAFRTNPKHELTQFGAGLYSAGNALGMFCLMKLFFFRGHRASDLALSCVATLFFSLYLVYDTYRIIGGKHRSSSMFGVKDWAVAAMELYQDIMQIFMHLLAIFGESSR